MSSIGGHTLYIISGRLHPLAPVLETITRPGVDGVAFRDIGTRSRPQRIVTLADFDTAAAARTAMAAYHALRGTIATVVDETGVSWPVAVLDVETPELRTYGACAGGLGSAASGRTGLAAVWLLQAAAVATLP